MRILLVLCFFVALPAAAGEKVIELSKLPEGSVATIDYRSDGCFHNVAVRYVFTAKAVTIFKRKFHWDEETKESLPPVFEKLGALQLSRDDLKKLDRTLEWYRTVNAGGCTTINRLAIRVTADKKVIAEENLIDGTCSIQSQTSILQLYKLDQRLERKNAKAATKKKNKSSK